MRHFILLFILSTVISCGIPDVTSIRLDLNRPFIEKLVPGDKEITIHFSSQNSEPAFSGYNIYFGDNVNPRKYKIYNQQRQLPTVPASKSEVANNYTFTIKIGDYYSTNNTIYQLEQQDIPNGLPLYIWVSSYQITPVAESAYAYDNYVKTATPRPQVLNQTISAGGQVTIEGQNMAQVINNAGTLSFQNAPSGSMMDMPAANLSDVNMAPTDGYGTADIEIKANRLYLVRLSSGSANRYGKIFVSQINGTASIVVDFCLQSSENIRSY